MKGPVLIVDDYAAGLWSLISTLKEEGYFFIPYTDVSKAMDEVKNGLKYKIAFIDAEFPGRFGGDDFVTVHKQYNPEIPIYTISGYDAILKDTDGITLKGLGYVGRIRQVLEDRLK